MELRPSSILIIIDSHFFFTFPLFSFSFFFWFFDVVVVVLFPAYVFAYRSFTIQYDYLSASSLGSQAPRAI